MVQEKMVSTRLDSVGKFEAIWEPWAYSLDHVNHDYQSGWWCF